MRSPFRFLRSSASDIGEGKSAKITGRAAWLWRKWNAMDIWCAQHMSPRRFC